MCFFVEFLCNEILSYKKSTPFASTILSPILRKPQFKPAFTVTPRYLYSSTSPISIPLKFYLLSFFAPFTQTTFDFLLLTFIPYFLMHPQMLSKIILLFLLIACHQTRIICIQEPSLALFLNHPILIYHSVMILSISNFIILPLYILSITSTRISCTQ